MFAGTRDCFRSDWFTVGMFWGLQVTCQPLWIISKSFPHRMAEEDWLNLLPPLDAIYLNLEIYSNVMLDQVLDHRAWAEILWPQDSFGSIRKYPDLHNSTQTCFFWACWLTSLLVGSTLNLRWSTPYVLTLDQHPPLCVMLEDHAYHLRSGELPQPAGSFCTNSSLATKWV